MTVYNWASNPQGKLHIQFTWLDVSVLQSINHDYLRL